MDADIEKKQNYLRTEILDKGFDPDQFLNFLIEKRGEDGSDLEKWAFSDLSTVVQEFVHKFANSEIHPTGNESDPETEKQSKPQIEQ